jgi:hypothetical protein
MHFWSDIFNCGSMGYCSSVGLVSSIGLDFYPQKTVLDFLHKKT